MGLDGLVQELRVIIINSTTKYNTHQDSGSTSSGICICGHNPTLKVVNQKPVIPSLTEIKANPCRRSAKLSAAERL
ncbi:16S rRNA (cytosine(1402)-N(4))-methyltransferase [Chloroflexota bacterium]